MNNDIFKAVDDNDLAKVKKCIEQHTTDVNTKDKYGWTPLYTASYYGRFEIVKYLVEHGADINAKDNDGETPLAKRRHDDIDEYLKSKGGIY